MSSRTLLIAAAALMTLPLARASAQAFASGDEHRESQIELYGGYSWLKPVNSGIGGYAYQEIDTPSATASLSFYLNRYLGLQAEGGYFSGNDEHLAFPGPCHRSGCDQLVYTAEGGFVFRYPMGKLTPFLHTLVGGERYNGPVANPLKWGWGVTGGIGVDYVLPWFNEHVAFRAVQADWQYSQVVYGPLVLPAAVVGGFGEMSAVKLSSGLILRFGDAHTVAHQLALGCSAQPTAVYSGEPITVTSSTIGLDMQRDAAYTWESNGGSISPQGSTVTVDTMGLRPGQYTVLGHVTQGSRANRRANCDAVFTVKMMLPPTVRCVAEPSTVNAGTPVTIRSIGTSPENRSMSYSYGTSGGVISGAGTLAQLNTNDVPPGTTITATCNVVDDLGQHASNTVDVFVSGAAYVPLAPIVPGRSAMPLELPEPATTQVQTETPTLCSVSFERDRRRPTRVDNEGKACLDDIALTMNRDTTSHLVMVGNSAPGESTRIAQERAANARRYLTTERGVDPTRVTVRVGTSSGRVVVNTLVPAGAIYDDATTTLGTYSTPVETPTRRRSSTPRSRSMSGVSRPPADATLPPPAPGATTTIAAPGTIPPLQ